MLSPFISGEIEAQRKVDHRHKAGSRSRDADPVCFSVDQHGIQRRISWRTRAWSNGERYWTALARDI